MILSPRSFRYLKCLCLLHPRHHRESYLHLHHPKDPLHHHEDREPVAEGSGASGAVHMVIDIPSFTELIVLSSNDEEELEPEEEVEPEMDEEDHTFVEQLEQELQEEPQEVGQGQDTEGSAATGSSDTSNPDYDLSRDY